MVGSIEMNTMEGVCRYCGTIQPVLAADQIDADNKISADCACGGAMKAKKKLQILDNIEAIAGENAKEFNFTPVDGKALYWLKMAGELMLEGVVDKIGVDIDGTKLMIGINAKGDVKVKRSKIASATLEA